jgi:hypothetical protein
MSAASKTIHQGVLDRLITLHREGVLPQALLITGPRYVGKETFAREVAQALTSGKNEADVLVLTPVVGTLTTDLCDELLRDFVYSSQSGGARVLIIPDAEVFSPAIHQKILKTLEEPLPNRYVILTSPTRETLLPTIVSRTVEVVLAPVSGAVLHEYFTTEGTPEFFFDLGLPGLLAYRDSDPAVFAQYQSVLGKLFRLSSQTLAVRMALAAEIVALGESGGGLLSLYLTWLARQSGVPLKFLEAGVDTVGGIRPGVNALLQYEALLIRCPYGH